MSDMPWRTLRALSRASLSRTVDLNVEGLAHVPASGPVILAARHFHHLIDGEVLMATLPRPAHLMVALDWATKQPGRTVLAAACRSARWPAVIRPDSPFQFDQAERRRALSAAMRESLQLLREGRILVVFPEAFPNVDLRPGPKADERAFLPFHDGFARLAAIARSEGLNVPIVPVGFDYVRGRRWSVTARFGQPITLASRADLDAVRAEVEAKVTTLSQPG